MLHKAILLPFFTKILRMIHDGCTTAVEYAGKVRYNGTVRKTGMPCQQVSFHDALGFS